MLYSVGEPIKYTDFNESVACMTDRSAEQLAAFYGYEDIEELSSSLPEDATVIDLGAGLSDLGHVVARRRPDINWTNFDARYGDASFPREEQLALAEVRASASSNLSFIGGNVTHLPDQVQSEKYARVFSYYMFPHILDYLGRDMAIKAMGSVIELVAFGGFLSTGPNRYTDGAWTVGITEATDAQALATEMIERYTEPHEAFNARRS